MSMKNSNDTIGNRTCNIPACSAVLKPTAPPCALSYRCSIWKVDSHLYGVLYGKWIPIYMIPVFVMVLSVVVNQIP
jgi:hypothetical protein